MNITEKAAEVYRDAQGSARWNPRKVEIIDLFENVDQAVGPQILSFIPEYLWGSVLDGTNEVDLSPYFQDAHDQTPQGQTINCSLGQFYLASTITLTKAHFWYFGKPVMTPFIGTQGVVVRPTADGSALFRLERGDSPEEVRGTAFIGMTVFETAHPAPATDPWSPANYGYVIDGYYTLGEINVIDCYAPGVNKFLRTVGCGRTNLIDFKGFVFTTLKYVDIAKDRDRTISVHHWPYLYQSLSVYEWMWANTKLFRHFRVDTPYYDDIFCFGGNTLFEMNQVYYGPYGGPYVDAATYVALETPTNPFPALAPTPVLAPANGSRTSYPLEGESSLPGVSGAFVARINVEGDPPEPVDPPLHSNSFSVFLVPSVGDPILLVENVDYTTTLNLNQSTNPGGTITTAAAYASGNSIKIVPVGGKEGDPHPFSTTNMVVGEAYAESWQNALTIDCIEFTMQAAILQHVGDFFGDNGTTKPLTDKATIIANQSGAKVLIGVFRPYRLGGEAVSGAGEAVEITAGAVFFDDCNRDGAAGDPLINLTGSGSVFALGSRPIQRNVNGAVLGVCVTPFQQNNVAAQTGRWFSTGAAAGGAPLMTVQSSEANCAGSVSSKGTGILAFAGGGATSQLRNGGQNVNGTSVLLGRSLAFDPALNNASVADGASASFTIGISGTDASWDITSIRHLGIDEIGWEVNVPYYIGSGEWTASFTNRTGSSSTALASGGIRATAEKWTDVV